MQTTKCPQCFGPIAANSVGLLHDNEQKITEFCQPICAIKFSKSTPGSSRILLKERVVPPVKFRTINETFIR